jgi:hypothetical protein
MIIVTEIPSDDPPKPGSVVIEFETPPVKAVRFARVDGATCTIDARNVFEKLKPLSRIRRAIMIEP